MLRVTDWVQTMACRQTVEVLRLKPVAKSFLQEVVQQVK